MKRIVALLLALLLTLAAAPVLAEKLTDEPVTFTIWMPEKSSLRDPVNTFLWDWIYEQTGVKFQVEGYSSTEQLQLMFANREFPDMLGGSYVTAMLGSIQTAGMDGDMVDLLPIFDQYCPTWKTIYEQNSTLKNGAMIDGHLYTLPAQLQTPLGSIRDQWIYIPSWLEEIGMEVPTTMDELTQVLTAIKNAAGTGTIPENVCPLYFFYDSNVGGQFDIYAAFGVLTGCNDQYLMADAEGKLVYRPLTPI